MPEPTVTQATFVIERHYPVAPARVFAAFSDPSVKRRWFGEKRNMIMDAFEFDFRVGGCDRMRFRFKEGSRFPGAVMTNDTTYMDIVADRRIVIAYAMTMGDHRFSASLSTFEFLPDAGGTLLVFTEQAAFFENSDGPQMREEGWRSLLDNLAKELAH